MREKDGKKEKKMEKERKDGKREKKRGKGGLRKNEKCSFINQNINLILI